MLTTTIPSYEKHTRQHTGAARWTLAGTETRASALLRGRRGWRGRRGGGFSLMEVLVALGIFAIGLVAVAAVFPTAISVQSETVRDLAGQRAVINARTMIQALARSSEMVPSGNLNTLTYKHDIDPNQRQGTLRNFAVPTNKMTNPSAGRTGFPGGVQPMLDQPLPPLAGQIALPSNFEMGSASPVNAATNFFKLFSQAVRSYPQNIAQSDQREYYWFPLIQVRDLTANNPTWMMYLMVMQRRGTEAVPQVRAARIDRTKSGGRIIALASSGANAWDNDADDDGLPDLIQPGDWVLDSRGTIHRVMLAERDPAGFDKITVESPIPVSFGNNDLIYFAVAIEAGGDWRSPVIKRETRSPIVRIDQFEIVVIQP